MKKITLPPFLLRVGRFFRRAGELFPFTPMGLCLSAAAAAAFWFYGIKRVDLVLLAIGGVTIGVAAFAFLTTTITAIVLALKLRKPAPGTSLRLECGSPTKTGFSVSTLWFVPLVSLKWRWLEPPADVTTESRGLRFHESIKPYRRGLYERVRRRIEVSDAFRLTRIVLFHDEPRAVRCLPSTGALNRLAIIRSMSAGEDMPDPTAPADGDRSDLKAYAPGDPVRFILWRVFAKSRQIVVRTPERAVSAATKAFVYLVAGEGDEAAAGAARLALESKTIGREWVFGVDGTTEDAKNLDKAMRLIAGSANTPAAASGAGLDAFLRKHGTGAVGRVLVFVPATQGAWVQRVAAAAMARTDGAARSKVEFLVCCDGIDRTAASPWLRRIMLPAPPRGSEEHGPWEVVPVASSTAVLQALTATRSRTLLVDRKVGRIYEAGQELRLAAGPPKPDARPVPAPAPSQPAARSA